MQEAFVRTYTGWSRVRTKDEPLPYLRTSVVNLAAAACGAAGSGRPGTASAGSRLTGSPRKQPPNGTTRTPRWQMRCGPFRSERPPRCVVLRYFLECSTTQYAGDPLGISEGSVKTHLHRTLGRLAPRLEELR